MRHDEHVLHGVIDPEIWQTKLQQESSDVTGVRTKELASSDCAARGGHAPSIEQCDCGLKTEVL